MESETERFWISHSPSTSTPRNREREVASDVYGNYGELIGELRLSESPIDCDNGIRNFRVSKCLSTVNPARDIDDDFHTIEKYDRNWMMLDSSIIWLPLAIHYN